MEIKILNKTQDKLVFTVNGINSTLANTLRRLMAVEVPVLAIDLVEFTKNSSALYDEMIAHRIGLVILKSDLESYDLQEDCKCNGKGCSKCQTGFSLKSNGPCNVYAEDMKIDDQKIKPVYPRTLIVKLAKGQALEVDGIITPGKGKVHAKHSPGVVYYRGYPIIKVSASEDTSAAVGACPTHVFKLSGKKAVVAEPMKCILCMACVEATNGNVNVEGSETDFLMFIEAFGQLKHKEMIEGAISIMNEKLDDFGKALKAAK